MRMLVAAGFLGFVLAFVAPFAGAEQAAEEEGQASAATQVAQAQVPSQEQAPGDQAEAPAPAPTGIEEIVVTAEKREAALQDTAIAVSAFTQDTMERMVINNATDYTLLVPNFSYREFPNRAFIRGVGRNVNALGLDPGVGIYTDGIYTSETASLYSSSFGTERIEILRGPQGTLYGRNTPGGAVNVISERPSEEFHVKGRAHIGNFDWNEYGLIVTGPATDWLRYHVMAVDATRDGWIDNKGGRDLGSLNNRYYRGQLEFDVTEDINVWLLVDKTHWDMNAGGNFGAVLGVLDDPYLTNVFNLSPLTQSAQFGWPLPNPSDKDLWEVDFNSVGHTRLRDTWSVRGQLSWDLGPVIFKYVGGYNKYDWQTNGGDLDKTSNPDILSVEFVAEAKRYQSHELQLLSDTDGPWTWIGGLYYYHEQIDQPYSIHAPATASLDNVLCCLIDGFTSGFYSNPSRLVYRQRGKLDSDAWAVFGDVSYAFNDQWELTAGLRYSRDDKEGEEFQQVIGDGLLIGFPGIGFDYSEPMPRRSYDDDWDAFTGRLVLNWTPDADTLVYASVSQGYKSGGFQLGSLQLDPVFDEETLIAYELGAKRTFADQLLVNAALFYYDYDDMQVLRAFREPTSGVTHAEVINADAAEAWGFELESLWQANESLLLGLNYSYLDAEYDDFCCVLDQSFPALGNQDLSGHPLAQSPEHKVTAHATYSLLTRVGTFAITTQFSWVDDQLYGIFDWPDKRWGDSYHRSDVFLSWTEKEERVRVIGFVKNVENDRNVNHVQLSAEEDGSRRYVNPNLPRTFGVEVLFTY